MSCEGECGLSNFGLSHPNPTLFVNSQWKIPQVVYMVYRIVIAVWFIVWVILSGVIEYPWYNEESDRVKWFIYLTNWMFFSLTVETFIEMVIVGVSIRRIKMDGYKSMPWYFKMMWVMYNVASTIGFVICIAYWALIYPYIGTCSSSTNEVMNTCGSPATPTCSDPNPVAAAVCVERCACPNTLPVWYDGSCRNITECPSANATDTSKEVYVLETVYHLHYVDVITHGSPIVYIVLNIFITGLPVRIQHFWHPIIYAVAYCIFTVIYDAAGGTNALGKGYIYSVLDWGEPGTAAIYAVIVGIVAPIVFWLIMYGLYWIRIAIAKCCCGLTDKNIHSYNDQNGISGSKDMMLSEQGQGHKSYTMN